MILLNLPIFISCYVSYTIILYDNFSDILSSQSSQFTEAYAESQVNTERNGSWNHFLLHLLMAC